MRKPLSIYIHIPFCAKKCNYCAFTSVCAEQKTKIDYIDALKNEIKLRSKEYSGSYEVKTIYIGGGTPSTLPLGEIKLILEQLYKLFIVRDDAEITIEVNPSSLTPEKAKEYVNAGINRVSMGLQSAQPHHLKTLGRLHTKETFASAIETLKTAGIKNISGDIMLALPSQTLTDVEETIDFMAKLDLNHISAYMLEIEEGTAFKKLFDANLLTLPSESDAIKLYNTAKTSLEKHGYTRYEVSNFSKENFESKHTQVYWQGGEYLGLGASAHSYIGEKRFGNTPDISKYIEHLQKNEIPLDFKETITEEEKQEEKILLELRTAKGLNLTQLNQDFLASKKDTIKTLIKDKFLILNPTTNHLYATDKGFMVLDKIIEMLV